MPIRPSLRWFYPLDWPQLSRWVRFERASGLCEECGRPHASRIACLTDGRWFDEERLRWRDGRGRRTPLPSPGELRLTRLTWVFLSAAHLDHDPSNSSPRNLAALCQRCHMMHDRPYHLTQRRLTYRLTVREWQWATSSKDGIRNQRTPVTAGPISRKMTPS
jgi:hypothetical protein